MTNFDDPIERELAALELRRREVLNERAARDAKRGIYYCSSCQIEQVFPEDGQDTCDKCLEAI